MSTEPALRNHAAFIWSVADLLRGDYKQSEYGKVILPLVVLRRLDCVLEPTKAEVLDRYEALRGTDRERRAGAVRGLRASSSSTRRSSTSRSCSTTRPTSPTTCMAYIAGFSPGAREVLDKFDFDVQIERLDRSNLLYLVVAQFCDIDLHPDAVSNLEMGYLYEELIRRFSELSNETAGEHFTPREVIRLMVNLLFIEDDDVLAKPGIVQDLVRPGLRDGRDALGRRGPPARAQPRRAARGLRPGAERRDVRDLPLRHDAQGPGRLAHPLRQLVHRGRREAAGSFDYMLANPPFGVEWKKVEDAVRDEHEKLGFARPVRCGPARASTTGRFLFLQHMISKMKPVEEGGSRLAIVFNGSPLFTGAAGSGRARSAAGSSRTTGSKPSSPCPTSSSTTPASPPTSGSSPTASAPNGAGKVQLVDAREFFTKMRKSLGREAQGDQPGPDRRDHPPLRRFEENEKVKIFPNEAFGYQRITVERPLRLRYVVDSETPDRLAASKLYAKLPEAEQERRERRAWPSSHGFSTSQTVRKPLVAFRRVLGTVSTKAREGAPRRPRRPRPRRAGHHEEAANRNLTPTCATTRTSRSPTAPSASQPTHRPRSHLPNIGTAVEEYIDGRSAAVRARRLGRPHQDEDRLRDPAHPALLQATCRRARSPRSTPRSSTLEAEIAVSSRGDRVNWSDTRLKFLAAVPIERSCEKQAVKTTRHGRGTSGPRT